mmetsp:Transcript_120666/g.352407  ORF Transcript_120666/g.352407 Transcript_120666/m.352407 type:complete len:108 (+) Transcript_120666:3-326(+)
MMRLQGMRPESFKLAVSETQLGKQIGNAMSCNVLERLFVRVLPAAGLVRHGTLRDRWGSGKPPAAQTAAGARRLLAKRQSAGAAACGARKRVLAGPAAGGPKKRMKA